MNTSSKDKPFSKDHPPGILWKTYRKKVRTRAIRIDGPFYVITRETHNGAFLCNDGYVALDSEGYPYPIGKEEFDKIYEEDPGVADLQDKLDDYNHWANSSGSVS